VDLESRSRRNNLIFKGLDWSKQTTDFRRIVSGFCVNQLGLRDDLWINRAHPLGRGGNAIIAHLPNDEEIEGVMSRVGRLKGSKYVVHRDFPWEVRRKRAMLSAVRKEVEKIAGQRRMPLTADRLIIEGTRFTWEGGRLLAGRQDGLDKLKSMFNHDFAEAVLRATGEEQERTTDTHGHGGQSSGTTAGDGLGEVEVSAVTRAGDTAATRGSGGQV